MPAQLYQGHAGGQCSLTWMYQLGEGVPQNSTEAARLYRLAADQGNAGGQGLLGTMYQNGTEVPQDYTEAARCTASPPTRVIPESCAASGGCTRMSPGSCRLHRGGAVVRARRRPGARSVTSGCCSAWARGSRTLDTEAARLTKLACDQGHQGCPRMRTKCDTTICRSPKKPKTKTKNLDPFKVHAQIGVSCTQGPRCCRSPHR